MEEPTNTYLDLEYVFRICFLNILDILCVCVYMCVYRVSNELRSLLRESVRYVKLYRYNPKHLYPKLNGYGDIGQRSLKL